MFFTRRREKFFTPLLPRGEIIGPWYLGTGCVVKTTTGWAPGLVNIQKAIENCHL